MTIKELAYSVQQHLQAFTAEPLKRAHAYELLSAAFGYKSYAAFGVDAIFAEGFLDPERLASAKVSVEQRFIGLGYRQATADTVALALAEFLGQNQIGIKRISELIAVLHQIASDYGDEGFEYEEERYQLSSELVDSFAGGRELLFENPIGALELECLESAADKGVAQAHYALALSLGGPRDNSDGGGYWYSVQQQEKEWADGHAAWLLQRKKREYHLDEAARLGEPNALLALNDPTCFELFAASTDINPAFMANLAHRFHRWNEEERWLTVAAEAGNTKAMCELIEGYHSQNLQTCWKWVYLAALLGEDLTADKHVAIHENGSPYDDDVGGTIFVHENYGIELDPLEGNLDRLAREAAQEIFSRIG